MIFELVSKGDTGYEDEPEEEMGSNFLRHTHFINNERFPAHDWGNKGCHGIHTK
jgi:hypothetical protein